MRVFLSVLRIATGCALLSAAVGFAAPGDGPKQTAQAALTNAQQVLALGLPRARAENVSVRLRGVVTYVPQAHDRWLYLQDDTAGILVVADNEPFRFAAGQLIEVQGTAMPGLFAVHVSGQTLSLLGTAPLPVPREATAAELAAGANFGRWVALNATVRDVAYYPGGIALLCASRGVHFAVMVVTQPPKALPVELLDARLSLRGLAWTDVDGEVRPVGFTLHQPNLSCYTVLRAGSSNLFNQASRPVSALRQPGLTPDARVKLTGTVTLASPSGWLAVQDETGTVWGRQLKPLPRVVTGASMLRELSLPPVQPGDRIELVGAPVAEHAFAPELEDVEYRRIGSGSAPEPRSVTGVDLTSGRINTELVTLKARVEDVETRREQEWFAQKLWLQADGVVFEAVLETRERTPLAVRRDDFVKVTGVCRMQPGQFQQVRSACLHLRGSEDLAVTHTPLWWTLRWAMWPLAGAGIVVMTGAVWITSLRRQVTRRTMELSAANRQLHGEVQKRQNAEVELRGALAAEKELNQLKGSFVSMVSHEIRTPLALILSSSEILQQYSDRLPAAKRAHHLETIHQAVHRMSLLMEDVLLFSRAEAGRLDFTPECIDLRAFCHRLVDEVRSATGASNPIEVTFSVSASNTRLDPSLVRYILTNLLTNAVKYSPPGAAVTLEVRATASETRFVVRDRGIGIPDAERKHLFTPFHRAPNAEHIPGTGLGLVIVKRCVERHGGTLELQSQEGSGTTALVSLPAEANGPAEPNPAT